MIKFENILLLCGTSRQELLDNNLENLTPETTERLEKKLESFTLIPQNGKIIKVNIRGTSFADQTWLKLCAKKWAETGKLTLKTELEPSNPKPPAWIITHDGKALGYLPAEIAPTLLTRQVKIAGILDFHPTPNSRVHNAWTIPILLGYGPLCSATPPPGQNTTPNKTSDT